MLVLIVTWKSTLTLIIFSLIIGVGAILVYRSNRGLTQIIKESPVLDDNSSIKAGQILSNGNCEGEGVPYKLSRSPMDLEDFSMIIPYGLMVGNHVTPIDHQYFAPSSYNSPIDSYPVYAMADSKIVDIGTRPRIVNGREFEEYRLVFTITCTYFYYYDLVTSLDPQIKSVYESWIEGGRQNSLVIDVAKGQVIGRIGGQTLDFAVWDTTKELDGFVDKSSYEGEPWKIYTADPLDYYTDDLRAMLLPKYIRTQDPVSGKIDYDIDGKLIGNWFLEGTGGYVDFSNEPQRDYWQGHLAVAPDHIDPSGYIVSLGDYGGEPRQFIIDSPSILPQEVNTKSGIVRYTIVDFTYTTSSGSYWDRKSLASDLTVIPNTNDTASCVIFQLVSDRELRMEYFPAQRCNNQDFGNNSKTYTR